MEDRPGPNRGGQMLADALALRGWSQTRAEAELGVSAGLVSRLISGDRKPGRAIAFRASEVLGVPLPAWDEPPARNGTDG